MLTMNRNEIRKQTLGLSRSRETRRDSLNGSILSRMPDHRIELIAPMTGSSAAFSQNVIYDESAFRRRISQVRRLRSEVYSIYERKFRSTSELTGEYVTPQDDWSWQIAFVGKDDDVDACVDIRVFEQRPAKHLSRIDMVIDRMDPTIRSKYQAAVESFWQCGLRSFPFLGEVGGWAIRNPEHNSALGIIGILGAYGFFEALGDAYVLGAASTLFGAFKVLQRLGGTFLRHDGEELGPALDGHYGCEMAILCFDHTRLRNSRYDTDVTRLADMLRHCPVIAPEKT